MAQDLEFKIVDEGAEIRLASTGAILRLPWRSDAAPHDLADARTLMNRRVKLHNALLDGLDAIASGQAPEDAASRAETYLAEQDRSKIALWEVCHLAIALLTSVPESADLQAAIPSSSDGLLKLATALFSRTGLSPDERENLRVGALEEFGIQMPGPDGVVRQCSCAELHGYGRCPNWPSYGWLPKAKQVWNDWRSAKAGGSIIVNLAYLDGAALLDRIRAELDAEAAMRAIEEGGKLWQAKSSKPA